MKSLACLLVLFASVSTYASDVWTVTSKDKTDTSPIPYSKVEKAVLSAVDAYKGFNEDLGEILSWECMVNEARNEYPRFAIDRCTAVLSLPKDWDWFGSFRLEFSYDRPSNRVTEFRYVWSKDNN